jgi:Fic family protein
MKDIEQKLNKRQDFIINLLQDRGNLGISEMVNGIQKHFGEITKVTVNRDLNELSRLGLVVREGRARAVTYAISERYGLVQKIDVDRYFKKEADKRDAQLHFNFALFPLVNDSLYKDELLYLHTLNKITDRSIAREFERLTIELSWKSSQIEGNTYNLLETEVLIKEHKEASGHKREEATMILNHKIALDYITKNKQMFKAISVRDIEHVHRLLTKDLGISPNVRKMPVGIVGTAYRPLDNEFQIREALEQTCIVVNNEMDPFGKALLLSLLIAYIQPFEDGNKRTSRLMANAVLLAYDLCPLSYRSVDEIEYKKAVILFYERNNLSYFKRLFIEQFEFAVDNYFKVS